MRKRQKGGGAIATSNGFTRCSIIVIECSRPIREMINCNVLNKDTLSFFFFVKLTWTALPFGWCLARVSGVTCGWN